MKATPCNLLWLVFGLFLVGCANMPWYSRPRDRSRDETTQTSTVFYATSRERTGNDEVLKYFGANKAKSLVHGTCKVELPPGGAPPQFPLSDALKYRDNVPEFYRTLNESIGDSQKPVVVFVHGFGTKFSDAILGTALLSRNLNEKFVPVSYSWPSLGVLSKRAYDIDREHRDFAARELVAFLTELRQNLPGRRIDLVAHSMGCHILLRACEDMSKQPDPPTFDNVVLAAADVDAADFRRALAASASKVSKRCTLYASDGDKALVFAMRNFYGSAPRAGYVWRGRTPTVTVAEGFDTVDISESDKDFVGHGYFLANGLVKDDMFNLLANDLPADRRNLKTKKEGPAKYYFIR